ncbi:MAG TPA: sugar kinase [Deltaproteobacteria bacterium]|nr:MAG: hypothetical protein DRP25_00400 [Thermotoga sp.]HDM75445.1 sugar kinase [Deltaproteobacteria bacterium]
MTEVACFGEPLVGFYATKTGKDVRSFTRVIGGDTSNVALAISKLGHTVKYITKIGDDIFGKMIKEVWKKTNIDVSNVFTDSYHHTGVYFTFFDSNGEHRFVYLRKNSAASNFTVKDAERVSLEGVRIFHLSGISQAISKDCLEASFYFMRRCKKLNIQISYDANYREALWSKDLFNSVAWFTIGEFADILTLNLKEAKHLGLKGEPEDIVKTLLKKGPSFVALKLGKDGCVIGSIREGIARGKAFEVNVKDTVGAGDAFTAALIVGILEGMNLEYIVPFTNAVAAMVCRSTGSTDSQPTRKEVEDFLRGKINP